VKTVVIAQREITPLLDQWRRSLEGTRQERQKQADLLWAEFVQSIVDAGGPPKNSEKDSSTDPPTHWCNFPGGFAQVVVEPPHRVGLFSKVQRVIVVDLSFSPGPPG